MRLHIFKFQFIFDLSVSEKGCKAVAPQKSKNQTVARHLWPQLVLIWRRWKWPWCFDPLAVWSLAKDFWEWGHAQATCAMISHQRWPMTNMNLLLRFPLGVDPATSNFSPKCWRCFPLLVSSKHFFNFGPWFLLSTISKNTSGCPVKFKIQDGRQRKTAVGLWVLWCFVG